NDQLQPTINETVLENESEDNYDYDEPKPRFPMGELKNLLTKIYSDCTLTKTEQQKILHVALKAISPAHTISRDKKGVFVDKLKDLGSITPETSFQKTALRKENIKLITKHLEPDLNLRKEIFNKATTTNHELDQCSDIWTTKTIQTKVQSFARPGNSMTKNTSFIRQPSYQEIFRKISMFFIGRIHSRQEEWEKMHSFGSKISKFIHKAQALQNGINSYSKLKGNDPVTSKSKNQTTKKRMLSSSTKEHNKSQKIGISNWEIVSYNECSTSCQTKNKRINKIEKQYDKNQGMECLFKNIRKSNRTTKMVGKTVEQLEWSILNNKHPISSNTSQI
ncbi:6467_t:CDS:2, partial [Gigaspora margarita]